MIEAKMLWPHHTNAAGSCQFNPINEHLLFMTSIPVSQYDKCNYITATIITWYDQSHKPLAISSVKE